MDSVLILITCRPLYNTTVRSTCDIFPPMKLREYSGVRVYHACSCALVYGLNYPPSSVLL